MELISRSVRLSSSREGDWVKGVGIVILASYICENVENFFVKRKKLRFDMAT